jgi:hypothetical protein
MRLFWITAIVTLAFMSVLVYFTSHIEIPPSLEEIPINGVVFNFEGRR